MKEDPKPVKKEHPEFVAYHFLNADGALMCMEEDGKSTDKFLKEGLNVDGSSIKGMCKIEKSDLKLVPEPESFLALKIDDFEHHRYLAHLVDDHGMPHPRDPRGIYQRIIDKSRKMGFEPTMFSETEFYIVDEHGVPVDEATYCSLPPKDVSYDFRQELGKQCHKCGMAVKRIHHENGPGQNEIELNLTPCMKNADDTMLTKWILELLAAKRKQRVLFSPKPFEGKAGNGMHHHILLRDLHTNENVFQNKAFKGSMENPADWMGRLSELAKQFIAGLLKYADDITAVFAASPESFQRLRPGFEAPIFKSWDFSNRTSLVRVPKSGIEMTRMEYRGGDFSGSIHLYGAVLLAAGLRGIEEKLVIPENVPFNVEKMSPEELKKHGVELVPNTFERCIEILKTSKFLEEAMGKEMVQYMIERDEKIIAGLKCPKCHPGHHE
jgi:glutamine synthetase